MPRQIVPGRPPKSRYETEEVGPASFITDDVDEPGSGITYIGRQKKDGTYWITKTDESSSPITIRHATKANNSESTYADAWANRTALAYNHFSVAF